MSYDTISKVMVGREPLEIALIFEEEWGTLVPVKVSSNREMAQSVTGCNTC
jgi:hypothetical protein